MAVFTALSRYALRRPWRVLLIITLVTLSALPGLWRLKLRTDGHALISESAPEEQFDRAIRAQFNIQDQLVVLVHSHHADGIFNPGTVQLVRKLTSALAQLPAINPSNIVSLATEVSPRFRPGTLVNQTLLESPLNTKAQLEQLRNDLRGMQLYTGTLVSVAGDSTLILIGVPPAADRTRLYQSVVDTLKALPSGPDEVSLTGAPVAESLLGIHILEDLGVPSVLLGVSSRGLRADEANCAMPTNLSGLRQALVRGVGLVPLAVLTMMLVLLVSFRNVLAMLVPLPGVLATLLVVFGFMGWFGVPVYLTTAVMPVLLTATGVTNDIYLFNRYFTLLSEKPPGTHVELLQETFARLAAPVAATSLTAAVGFLSFGLSPLRPVRAFGVCTALGVLFSLLYSFTAVPALLAVLNPKWFVSPQRGQGISSRSLLAGWFGRVARFVVRQRRLVLGLFLLVTALTPFGLCRLAVQDSWINGFAPQSDFRRVTGDVNRGFYGMHLLFVSFDASKTLTGEVTPSELVPGTIVLPRSLVTEPVVLQDAQLTLLVPVLSEVPPATNTIAWHSRVESAGFVQDHILALIGRDSAPTNFWAAFSKAGRARFALDVHSQVRPDLIRKLQQLQDFIAKRASYAVGGVLSPADYLATAHYILRSGDPQARHLPNSGVEIKMLWDYCHAALGAHRMQQLVDSNYWCSLTTVFLKDANFADTGKLMKEIRDYEREQLAPEGIKLGFAGDVASSQSLIRGIVTTQLQSLFLSLLGIGVVMTITGGSLRWGVYCLLPSALAVLVKLAIMGWVGMPLGVATSMFAAMTVGIGVNCAIHLLEAYRQARTTGTSPQEAVTQAMCLTGPPALINTAAVSLGFGVLMLSQVPANGRLGLLLVLGLMECFVASMALLPLLLSRWHLGEH